MRRRSARQCCCLAVIVGAAGALFAACVYAPTQVLIAIDTDIPSGVPLTLRAAVREGSPSGADGGFEHSWTRGTADGGLVLPGTFGVRPASGGARDACISVFVEAATPDGVIRRVLRGCFRPGQTQQWRAFLSVRCLGPSPACRTVPAALCTRQVLCEESAQTCGENGECVDPVTTTVPRSDAPTMDSVDAADIVMAPTCGPGRSCCLPSVPCSAGQVCTDGNVCRTCGVGLSCCSDGATCTAGRACGATGCESCGGDAQVCCAGSACNSGLVCQSGSCVSCGATGQPCCASSACQSGRVCDGNGVCRACGNRSELCCTGDRCSSGLNCTRAFMGIPICQCGQRGITCCGGTMCDPGLTCTTAFMGIPICQCGIEGTLCCGSTTCEAPLQCSTAFMGIPICVR